MRWASMLMVWLVCVGGLGAYQSFRAGKAMSPPEAPAVQPADAQGRRLEIIATFTAEPDPFALVTESEDRPPALRVRLADRDIVRHMGPLAAGTVLMVDPLEGLLAGDNELYIEASPPVSESGKHHAVRVRAFENDRVIAESSFWSVGGGVASGVMTIRLNSGRNVRESS